jgi:hypothetical protein
VTRRSARRELLDALANFAAYGWASADAVQRTFRRTVYDQEAPSVTLVGRRLSRLAAEGRCEKKHDGGMGYYRSTPRTTTPPKEKP